MNRTIAIAVVLAGIGTFAMRASFLLVSGWVDQLGATGRRYLRQIPPAALAAIVVPEVLRPHGELDLLTIRPVVALVTAIVAARTRSATRPLVAGIVVIALAELAH